jgi:hypothetical protein
MLSRRVSLLIILLNRAQPQNTNNLGIIFTHLLSDADPAVNSEGLTSTHRMVLSEGRESADSSLRKLAAAEATLDMPR